MSTTFSRGFRALGVSRRLFLGAPFEDVHGFSLNGGDGVKGRSIPQASHNRNEKGFTRVQTSHVHVSGTCSIAVRGGGILDGRDVSGLIATVGDAG